MARVNNISTLIQGVNDVAGLRRFVAASLDAILAQLNGKLDFGDNLRTFGPIQVTFSTVSEPQKIVHGLGRVPVGYFITGLDRVATIYYPSKSTFPWTETQFFLQSNTAGAVVDVMVF